MKRTSEQKAEYIKDSRDCAHRWEESRKEAISNPVDCVKTTLFTSQSSTEEDNSVIHTLEERRYILQKELEELEMTITPVKQELKELETAITVVKRTCQKLSSHSSIC